MQIGTKICVDCKDEFPLELFNKNSTNKDGKHRYCRECDNKRSKQYYRTHAEEQKIKKAEYSKKNKEIRNQNIKKYKQANKGILTLDLIALMSESLQRANKNIGLSFPVGKLKNLYVRSDSCDSNYLFYLNGVLFAYLCKDFKQIIFLEQKNKYNKSYTNRLQSYFTFIHDYVHKQT